MPANSATTSVINWVNAVYSQAGEVAGQAAASGRELWLGFLNINWSTPTWDVVILLFFIVTALLYGFALGRDRIVALLVSTYLALAVATNFPYLDKLSEIINQSGFFTFQVSAFFVIFVGLFILLSQSRLIQGLAGISGHWWQIFLFSFLQTGLLISIILSFLPQRAIDNLLIFTQVIFVSDLGRFSWIILPILALVFIGIGRRPIRRRHLPLDEFGL